MPNPRSTAIIAGHPIHPMLIPFPIAFFVGTFICDLIYWQTSIEAWAAATPWLLGAGLVMAALAAVMGVIDVFGDQQIRQLSTAWWHASLAVQCSEGRDVPKGDQHLLAQARHACSNRMRLCGVGGNGFAITLANPAARPMSSNSLAVYASPCGVEPSI